VLPLPPSKKEEAAAAFLIVASEGGSGAGEDEKAGGRRRGPREPKTSSGASRRWTKLHPKVTRSGVLTSLRVFFFSRF
jgi:hypothetical protein